MSVPKLNSIVIILFGLLAAGLPAAHLLAVLVVQTWGAPVGLLAWKEVLTAGIITTQSLVLFRRRNTVFWPLAWVYALVVGLALFSSYRAQVPLREVILGFRVELWWLLLATTTTLWLGVIQNYLETQGAWVRTYLLVATGLGLLVVSTVSLATLWQGPVELYSSLGVSGGWEVDQSGVLQSPLCHSIDTVSAGCRLTGGFATPNNFAGYLLLLLPLVIIYTKQLYRSRPLLATVGGVGLGGWLLVCIYLSFARFAYVALLAALAVGLIKAFRSRLPRNLFKVLFSTALLSPLLLLLVFLQIGSAPIVNSTLPTALTKPGSTLDHYRKTRANWEIVRTTPGIIWTGYGLGQAGTLAKPQYKDILSTPIVTRNLAIAEQYDIRPWELPVPENWYLQLVLNGGGIYALLSVLLLAYPLRRLGSKHTNLFIFALGLYAVCVGNLFLHLWENPVVSTYYVLTIVWSELWAAAEETVQGSGKSEPAVYKFG